MGRQLAQLWSIENEPNLRVRAGSDSYNVPQFTVLGRMGRVPKLNCASPGTGVQVYQRRLLYPEQSVVFRADQHPDIEAILKHLSQAITSAIDNRPMFCPRLPNFKHTAVNR